MWIKTESKSQNVNDLWLADIMGDHYDRGETPEWHSTDDGYRKANWKEAVATELVRNHPFEKVDGEDDNEEELITNVPDVDPE